MDSCRVFAAVSVGEDVSKYIPAAPILLPEGPWHQVSNRRRNLRIFHALSVSIRACECGYELRFGAHMIALVHSSVYSYRSIC